MTEVSVKLAYVDEDAARAELEARAKSVADARPFPTSTLKLARLTRDPYRHMDEIIDVLETDPGLCSRLLRLVNSATFALRTECTSVRHAAALVGNSRLNDVATSWAITDMYGRKKNKIASSVLEHTTVVGALARYLRRSLRYPGDEFFTCGFLHDLGKLMLLDMEGPSYELLLAEVGTTVHQTHLLERERLGFDHAQLAGAVLRSWNIPEPVPQVVEYHHNLDAAYKVSVDVGRLVAVVQLADHLSVTFRTMTNPKKEVPKIMDLKCVQRLQIPDKFFNTAWNELDFVARDARQASKSGTAMPESFSMRPD